MTYFERFRGIGAPVTVFAGMMLFSASAWAAKPTFSETIAPILYQNCTSCHRPGEAAPFSLISYDDARKRGSLLAAVTKSRYMPPWHAEHGYGEFSDERRLTDEQIGQIEAWVKDGMPEGDRSKMPQMPKYPEGWHLGKPDLILEMTSAFDLPASGPDMFKVFSIPTGITEDKWVRAIEFRPSARKAVHHSLFSYSAGGGGRGALASRIGGGGRGGRGGGATVNGNSLGGWAVGATPTFLPDGLAFLLPKGSDFILQTHFHLTGKAESEKSVVGLYFADHAPERSLQTLQLPALFGIGAGLDIVAGDKNFTIKDSVVLPADVEAYAVSGHAHYLGKEMEMTATLPDGSKQPLLWIKNWDFNWQDRYNYKAPVLLPKGTRIDAKLVYDNSAENPKNPSQPPKEVWWGEQSFDEMGSVSLILTAVHKEDELAVRQAVQQRSTAAVVQAALSGGLQRVIQFRTEQAGQR